jgi:amino acid permease
MKKKEEEAMEFGGPIGAVIGFISLPVMVYYLWICARFYGGLAYPEVGCVLLCM